MKSHEFLAEADSTKFYEIKRGDTLSRIAIDKDTTVDAIMALNQGNRAIRDRDTIYAGGVIKLPTKTTGFDPSTRVKRQGAASTDTPDDIAKIGSQEFPKTSGPKVGPNADMGGENFGIDNPDWELPTVELGFGDPGYTPLIGNRVEKRPDGNWYFPDGARARPDVARFAEKRLKDVGSQKTLAPAPSNTRRAPGGRPSDITAPTRPGQVRTVANDISPIPGAWMTDRFGSPRLGRTHQGIGLHADVGTPVLAPNSSKV